MKFLLISQRAFPNPNFRLNDLTGHGRIDVVMRCILAACRPMPDNEINSIYCYLKGSEDQEEHGWLTWDKTIDNHDEVSLAAHIQDKWKELFNHGNLTELIQQINCRKIIHLHEDGELIVSSNELDPEVLLVLGAQSDLMSEDIDLLNIDSKIRLASDSMLASQVIVLVRQLGSM
jgi:tRNA pseudouridine-54 N-methylase